MSVVWTWHGAVTPSSVRVRARVNGDSAALLVSEAEDISSPVSYGPVSPNSIDMASVAVDGLEPSRRYFYRWSVDGVEYPDYDGTFRTAPPADGSPQSFTFMAAGDAGLEGAAAGSEWIDQGISDNPVFDVMRRRAVREDHLGFIHAGDAWYRDGHDVSLGSFRDTYDDLLTFNGTWGHEARQGRFFRSVNLALNADDHDLFDNNTDRDSRGRDNYLLTYREHAPHYPLPAGDGAEGIYQSWEWGRVLFITADVRAYRDPNSDFGSPEKTMLGTAQKRWMEHVLSNTDAKALVWVLPSLWLSDQGNTRNAGIGYSGADYSSDSYWRFRYEREELVQLFGDLGWLDRMLCLQADKHALSLSSGPNNPWGGFPLFMVASMDASFATNPEGQYDLGQSPGRQRYGTVRVQDSGHTIALQCTGYVMDQVWRSHTAYAHVEPHVLQVNYAAGETFDPFEPTDDDQRLLNDYTASRMDGGEFRHEHTNGPLGVDAPPQGVGRYSGSGTFNVPSDEDLPDQAGWRVHKGTVDEARFPAIGFNLANPRMEPLREDIARLDAGDRLEVHNPPPWLPPDPIGLLAEGYEERINTHEWEIEYNASPAQAVEVARVAPAQVLNPNHHFEVNVVGGWEPVGGAVVLCPRQSYRGTYSARLEPGEDVSEVQLRSRAADSPRLRAGREYEFSCWVRSATGHPVGMRVRWINEDGELIGTPPLIPEQVPPVGEWVRLRGSAVAPDAAVSVEWVIFHHNPGGVLTEEDELWVDEAIISDGAQIGLDEPNRVDTSGSELVVPVNETESRLWVRTLQTPVSGARWINSEGPTVTHGHQFPFDVRVGGEVMRVTGTEPGAHDLFRGDRPEGSWGTTEQGLTWDPLLPQPTEVGTDPHNLYGYMRLLENTSIVRGQTLPLPFPVTDCEALFSVRTNQQASGQAQLPALLLRFQGWGGNYYRCRFHLYPSGAVSLSITRGVDQIGDAVHVPHLFYTPGPEYENRLLCRVRIIGHQVMARAWRPKRDMDGIDGSGLDISYQEPHTWHISRTVEDDPIEEGGVGFSASTFGSYTGVEPELRFQLLELMTPQLMSVERSVNGVVKEHPAGTSVRLARPATIGL